jgi:hypothetical protein
MSWKRGIAQIIELAYIALYHQAYLYHISPTVIAWDRALDGVPAVFAYTAFLGSHVKCKPFYTPFLTG